MKKNTKEFKLTELVLVKDAYNKAQKEFDNINDDRDREINETTYHLRQIHRLLYILVNENK